MIVLFLLRWACEEITHHDRYIGEAKNTSLMDRKHKNLDSVGGPTVFLKAHLQ